MINLIKERCPVCDGKVYEFTKEVATRHVCGQHPDCPYDKHLEEKANKPPHWKQANPKDQFVALLGNLEGHISNLFDGVPVTESKINAALNEVKNMKEFLKDSW